MKKTLLTIWLLLSAVAIVRAQGEQNVWIFGDQIGLDFNTSTPTPVGSRLAPGYEGCASICNASGQLLFYSNGARVWNRYNNIMPHNYPSRLPYTGGAATQAAAISGVPGHSGKYYLFSINTYGQVFYSLVDMSLDSGRGDIVAGKMYVFLSSGNTEKMTVVKGCNNIWLLVRSLVTNEYKAYEINDTGIVTTPVSSTCGKLPLTWYRCGVIKFSPDGRKLAAACNMADRPIGGLEMYDFDMKTGIVSNAVVLDSSNTTAYYYGACFSPDNTKLYASICSYYSVSANALYPGMIKQFDVSLASPSAIIASNTLIYSDTANGEGKLGDLKRGIDGKIYISTSGNSSGTFTPYLHCINSPNTTGIGCNFVPNVINLGWVYRGLPNDIALMDAPDAVQVTKNIAVCFNDSILLTADTGKRYHWQDGSRNQYLSVHQNGIYIAGYINANCNYEIDSFKVNFIHVPVISPAQYSCVGQKSGKAWISPAIEDTAIFVFTWKDRNGDILQQHTTHISDTITGLDTGVYSVQVHTIGGCDTVLRTQILPIPSPQVSGNTDPIKLCKDIAMLFSASTDAPVWQWQFGDGDSSADQTTTHSYRQTGNYTAIFTGTNIEGCSATISMDVQVKDFKIQLSSDKELVNIGEQIVLQSSGNESYVVTAWRPSPLFTDQAASGQAFIMDTSRTFTVTGRSADGCMDSATIAISINPIVFMPTAFTPNGDGLNDRFRPHNSGDGILIRDFKVFDRWEHLVWSGRGISAAEGWDGSFHGVPADIGTYFYTISIETIPGKTIALKGDVTLIR